jgi:hypothetical protein
MWQYLGGVCGQHSEAWVSFPAGRTGKAEWEPHVVLRILRGSLWHRQPDYCSKPPPEETRYFPVEDRPLETKSDPQLENLYKKLGIKQQAWEEDVQMGILKNVVHRRSELGSCFFIVSESLSFRIVQVGISTILLIRLLTYYLGVL